MFGIGGTELAAIIVVSIIAALIFGQGPRLVRFFFRRGNKKATT